MPRPKRSHLPGGLYHVMARAPEKQSLFIEGEDCLAFIKALARLQASHRFRLYAFCLMADHFHLLIEVGQSPLAALMQRLLTRYSKIFRAKHGGAGPLLAQRYTAILCQKELYLKELIRYLHLNSVRAGYAKSPSQWPWSSHHEYMGSRALPLVDLEPLLLFHRSPQTSRRLYQRFIDAALKSGHREDLYPSGHLPVLGDDAFLRKHGSLEGQPRRGKPLTLARLAAQELKTVAEARLRFVRSAIASGHKPSAVAAFLGVTPSAVSKLISRAE